MIRWSLLVEFFSLFVLGIIFVRYYCYERQVAFTPKRKLFLYCLLASVASIFLNILCVYTLSRPGSVPLWVNMCLNSLYFLLSAAMCTLFAYFLLVLILEHVYDSRCLRSARRVLLGITLVFAVLAVSTPFTGLLFYFDENGYYQRGPLNQIGYVFLILELLVLAVCFIRNRNSVSTHMVYVMRSLPPFILVLSLFQLAYPEILLNGALSAAAALILFIAFQSHTNDHDSLTGVRSHNNFLTELSLRIAGRQPCTSSWYPCCRCRTSISSTATPWATPFCTRLPGSWSSSPLRDGPSVRATPPLLWCCPGSPGSRRTRNWKRSAPGFSSPGCWVSWSAGPTSA